MPHLKRAFRSIANPRSMAADPLSDVLKTVRLTGAVFFDIAAQGPWAVASPSRDLILPKVLPGADHLIAYHVVTAGQCFATAVGGQPVPVKAGEVVVFTQCQPHIMSSQPGMRAEPPAADVLEFATAGRTPFEFSYGDGKASTRLVCGYFACDARPFNPLLESLPSMFKAGGTPVEGGSRIVDFIRIAVAEAAGSHAGRDSVLTKLSELMFVEVLRRYLAAIPPEQAGWLASLRDPTIARALSLIHAKPAYDWTLEELAKQAGLSRSVMAERFTELVGLPPMHYLAKWRMQIASELLTSSNANIARIAAETGYGSEESFSRAFKKIVGVAPSAWRRREPGATGRG
jgi:AraC-like DNA-binding protein